MIDLKNKTVLVTGASRGIGAAIVRVCVAAGANVVIHYGQARDRAEALAAELGADRCLLLAADLTDPASQPQLWADACAWKGNIDVLVNNAGIFEGVAVDAPYDEWCAVWNKTMQVNMSATANLCRDAIGHFKGQGGGIIINVTSRAAFRGDDPDFMHYAASKAAVVALTRSIARGFAPDGILAYVVAPGFTRTEMAEAFVAEYGEDAATANIPLGKMATPEEVAHMVAFLATGLVPSGTGSVMDINGASYVR